MSDTTPPPPVEEDGVVGEVKMRLREQAVDLLVGLPFKIAWVVVTALVSGAAVVALLGKTQKVSLGLILLIALLAALLAAFLTVPFARHGPRRVAAARTKELALANRKVERLELKVGALTPQSDAGRKLASYTNHIRALLEVLSPNSEQSLSVDTLLTVARQIMDRAGGPDAVLSLWQVDVTRMRAHPDASPDHSRNEVRDFDVERGASQIQLKSQEPARVAPGLSDVAASPLVGIDDLQNGDLGGGDVDVFRKHGFRSVRGVKLDLPSGQAWLIALCRAPNAFTSIDDQYLVLLGRVAEIGWTDLGLKAIGLGIK
jgi:hypothetical protein